MDDANPESGSSDDESRTNSLLPYAHTRRAADEVHRPEIVLGLVGAVGTRLNLVEAELGRALSLVQYNSAAIRVSSLITDLQNPAAVLECTTQMDRLMDLGDSLRASVKHGAAAAALTVFRISSERGEWRESTNEEALERQAHATIVRSLKHPEEVRLLRAVYGPRFILIGVWSPPEERAQEVGRRLSQNHAEKDEHWRALHIGRLMQRDEKDSANEMGQRVRDTFELADAYISLRNGVEFDRQISRIVRLLFGEPFETPTWEEQAMYLAHGAKLRSADAGRQVGAVVVDEDFEVVVTGTNEVPKPFGGQYWATDMPDHRDFRIGYDANSRLKMDVVRDVLKKLQAAPGWLEPTKQGLPLELLAREAVKGPLAKSPIGDLIEFGRIVHAEMAAICTAARRGTRLRGTTLLTTTYPCHECARLIIAAGIARVVYVDPYPKSRVPELFRNEINDQSHSDQSRIRFDPFVGIAPRLYSGVFAMTSRSRDAMSGDFAQWDPAESQPRLVVDADATFPIQRMEDMVIEQLREDFNRAGITMADQESRTEST